jgi:GT2 family glycosyltransferase
MRVAVLMTSFNRKQKTLNCLGSLLTVPPACELEVFLLDDASPDGTAKAVEEAFSSVNVLHGDGNSYWSGGMRLAWKAAEGGDFDAFLLLNDDVALDPSALDRLIDWSQRLGPDAVLGCPVRSSDTGEYTYGGNRRVGIHPWKFQLVAPPKDGPEPVDALHGNIMLVPRKVHGVVGGFPSYLVHQGGDFVYSLRAGRAGFKVLLLPGFYGTCDENPPQPARRGFAGLKRALQKKNLPMSYTVPLYREQAGITWPFWWAVPYLRAFFLGF